MSKPDHIFDRDREWAELEKIWRRKRPELVFVLGQRRVGKSLVLSSFADSVEGLYFQATRRGESEQVAALTRALGERFGDPALAAGTALPNWEAIFDYITQKAGEDPFLLVLDEFPYLSDVSPALPSIIQHYWDHAWKNSRLRLVLCGSYITAMQQLEVVDQPLYGRRTAKLVLGPFDAFDAGHFVPSWSARDQMLLWGTVGHLPGHLALVDASETLGENCAQLLLSSSGRLVDDAQHALDAFVSNPSVYYSIVSAIAQGQRTWSGITSRVGKSGGSLTRPIAFLEQMEVIERVVPITENPAKSKRVQYRVTDPYVRLWHRHIEPLVQRGSIGLRDPAALWQTAIEPQLNELMGDAFEQICRSWVARKQQPFAPVQLGSWWDAKSRHEVDIAALSGDDDLFVAECKWGRVGLDDLQKLRERARLIERECGRVRTVKLGLFSGRGDFESGLEELDDVLIVSGDDMFNT